MGSNETSSLHKFLNQIKNVEKDLNKMSSSLSSNLGSNLEKVMHEYIFESEKKMKINKCSATVSLAKDGSLKIVFDNPEHGLKFYKGEK